jgi:putative addiction module component (TIGR02574 family)
MKATMKDITEQVLTLPLTGRAFLAEKLLESLDSGKEFKLSPEWQKEISKRCDEIDNGTVDLIPSEQVFNKAFRSLG